MISETQEFFSSVTKSSSHNSQRQWEDLCFIFVNEFHWNMQDIYSADIPFIFDILRSRERMIKQQELDSKKRR